MRKNKNNYYPTWQEASKAAIALGINKLRVYFVSWSEDPGLPSRPDRFYSDFPGYSVFLGNINSSKRKKENCYPTWEEAAKGAKKIGIKSVGDYRVLYFNDPKLPSKPNLCYKDFPGFQKFCGRTCDVKQKVFYLTWQEVVNAALKLGIKTGIDYNRLRKADPLLPYKDLLYKYTGFPGFPLSRQLTKKVA